MALNYTALEALTNEKKIPKLIDNVFKATPLLAALRERAKKYDGGYKIIEPIIHGELNGVTSYSGYDVLTYDQNTPITAAEFEPKNVVGTIIFSKDEELKNEGSQEVLNLLDSKVKIAELTLKKKLTTMLLGDGTGNGGKDMAGLAAAIADTGVYGGIDRAVETFWRANVLANAGAARALSIPLMLKSYMVCADGTEKPDFILCDKRTWMAYHELVRGQITLNTDAVKKMIDMGFETLEFRGVPLVYDEAIDTTGNKGTMWFLNTKYMNFRLHKNANFTPTKFRPDDSRLAMKKEILVTGNLTFNNLRRHAVLKDIDVAAY